MSSPARRRGEHGEISGISPPSPAAPPKRHFSLARGNSGRIILAYAIFGIATCFDNLDDSVNMVSGDAGDIRGGRFKAAASGLKERKTQMSKPKRSRNVTTSRRGRSAKAAIVPVAQIDRSILLIRGEKVILDADLAELYGVETKVLNQAVKRNIDRFPDDFMFRLNKGEKAEVVTSCDHLERLKYSPVLPRAFTEHGAIMAATVLNSPRAVQVSVYVVRAFVRLRRMLAGHKDLAAKLDKLEGKVGKHDRQIVALIDAIRQLMAPPPEPPKKQIGFQTEAKG